MKKIFALLALVGLAAAPTTGWAKTHTYDGKLTVTAVGSGQVSASQTTTAGAYGTTVSASYQQKDETGISHWTPDSRRSFTFYAFAQPNANCVFVGWYADADCTGNVLSTDPNGFKYTFDVDVDKSRELQLYAKFAEHQHDWRFVNEGGVLTVTCVNQETCPVKSLSLHLSAAGKTWDGQPFVVTLDDAEVASLRQILSARVSNVCYYQGGGRLVGAPYLTGDYTAKVDVIVGVDTCYTVAKDFSITKPAGGYAKGYEIADGLCYNTVQEAQAAAKDGDTIYCHDIGGDDGQNTYDFTSDKNVTFDLCGRTVWHKSGDSVFDSDTGDMYLKQDGVGAVKIVNGTIRQPKNVYAHALKISGKGGKLVFGQGVFFQNYATTKDKFYPVTVSGLSLTIEDGDYLARFSCGDGGSLSVVGGCFGRISKLAASSGECEFNPTPYVDREHYVVRADGSETKKDATQDNGSWTMKYVVRHHEHDYRYSAEGGVITYACRATDNDVCGGDYGTLTLTATDAKVTGQPYEGAAYAISGIFPASAPTIEFWQDGEKLAGAPADSGSYVAKVTVEGATAEVAFSYYHVHKYEFTLTGNTLTATCQAAGSCDKDSAIISLNVESREWIKGTTLEATVSDSFADADTAKVIVHTVGDIVYKKDGVALGAAPKLTGSYTAEVTVTVDGTTYTLTKAFSITKPADGYTSGCEVGKAGVDASTWIAYDTLAEAFAAAAEKGDTVYYRESDFNQEIVDFSTDKDLTLDLCGKTVKYNRMEDLIDRGVGDMTIQNLGTGTLTLLNAKIEQPKNVWAHNILVKGGNNGGKLVFGSGVSIANKGDYDTTWPKVEVSGIELDVTGGGTYEIRKFSGSTVWVMGGTFWENYDPSDFLPNHDDYVVRDRYTVLPHEHVLTYAANGNVITVTCTAENADICTYKPNNGEKLTLTAATVNVADLGGDEYKGAGYVCTDKFPVKDAAITYWQGDQQLAGAPTDAGDYVAKVTVGDATAEAPFSIIHIHTFAYDAVDAMTIGVKCTEIGTCGFQTVKAATLTADDSKDFDGAPYAATFTLEEGFPTDYVTVSLEYWVKNGEKLEAAPSAVGSYTVKMIASEGDTTRYTLEKDFTIAKADLASVTFALKEGEFKFDHEEHTAVLATHALGGYVLEEDVDYVLGGDALTQVGSPAANTTYTIEITATGDNFTGSRTLSWTIKTPITGTAKFDKPSAEGAYGTVEGYALKVTDTTKMVYGNNAWEIRMTVGVPHETWVFTPTAFFYFDSPKLDKAFVATDADARAAAGITKMETEDVFLSGEGYQYLKSFTWVESITLAEVEAALANDETNIVRTLKAYAMPYHASAGYQNAGGIPVTEFAMEIPLTDLVLPVPAEKTLDAGDAAISDYKLQLGLSATVTANAQVTDFAEKLIPDSALGGEHYEVVENQVEDVYQYTLVAKEFKVNYYDVNDTTTPLHTDTATLLNYTDLHIWSGEREGYDFLGYERENGNPLEATDAALHDYIKDEAEAPGCDGEVKVFGTWKKPIITIHVKADEETIFRVCDGEGDDVASEDLELPADTKAVTLTLEADVDLTVPVYKVVTNGVEGVVTSVTTRVATYAIKDGDTLEFFAEEADETDPTVTDDDIKTALIESIDDDDHETHEAAAKKVDDVVGTDANQVSARDLAAYINKNRVQSFEIADCDYVAASVKLDTDGLITEDTEVEIVELVKAEGDALTFEVNIEGAQVEVEAIKDMVEASSDLTDWEKNKLEVKAEFDEETSRVKITPEEATDKAFMRVRIPKDPGVK